MSLSSPVRVSSRKSGVVLPKAVAKRRADIIARIVMWLGIFGVMVFGLSIALQETASGEDLLYLAVYGMLSLLGYQLKLLRLGAFRTLRVLSWIGAVGGGLLLLSMIAILPFTLQLLGLSAFSSLLGFLLLIALVFNLITPVLCVILLVITQPAQIRALYR